MPVAEIDYFPPFSLVKKNLQFKSVHGQVQVSLPYDELIHLVKLMVRSVHVDERWYLAGNPDVVTAIKNGQIRSAREHWIEFGYFEGRWPCQLAVDPDWYLRQYPDVAQALATGAIQSPLTHFLEFGYQEGRLPASISGAQIELEQSRREDS